MKPMNFPGRRLARRESAMARFATTPKQPSTKPNAQTPKERERERTTLLARSLLDSQIARAIRTKKDRRDRAKFAQR